MTERATSGKSADAYRTISEVAEELKLPQHVLRFWETRFPQVRPLKRAGGRRFYRPEDVALLRAIKSLLYGQGYTIKGVQRMLQEQGPRTVAAPPSPAGAGPPRPDRPRPDAAAGDDDRISGGAPLPVVSDPAPSEAAPRSPSACSTASLGMPATDGLRARLETVASDLSECSRLIAAARSART